MGEVKHDCVACGDSTRRMRRGRRRGMDVGDCGVRVVAWSWLPSRDLKRVGKYVHFYENGKMAAL